jgi:hypothetical protein
VYLPRLHFGLRPDELLLELDEELLLELDEELLLEFDDEFEDELLLEFDDEFAAATAVGPPACRASAAGAPSTPATMSPLAPTPATIVRSFFDWSCMACLLSRMLCPARVEPGDEASVRR